MRIAFIVHTFFPKWHAGTEVYTRSLARQAIMNGHEAFIVCYEPTPDGDQFEELMARDTIFEGIPVHRISFSKTHSVFHLKDYYHAAVEEHLAQYLSTIWPDIVHVVHSMHLSTASIWAAKKLGLPVVATATDFWYVCPTYQLVKHDESLCCGPVPIQCLACVATAGAGTWLDRVARRNGLSRLLSPVLLVMAQLRAFPRAPAALLIWLSMRRSWMKKAVSQIDVLLVPTPNTASLLGANGVTAITVRTCGFGLERHSIAAPARKADSVIKLGYIGTFRQSKGVHVLLEAMRQLPVGLVQLQIYGKVGHFPEYDKRLFELAKGLDNITFSGTFPNEKLPEIFAGFDALVIPALWYENSPLVLLSAFAQKVPVVASRVGSLADLVEHGKNGLLFEMGSALGLAAQLRRLVDDPGLIARLREGIPEVKTIDENMTELFGIYENLISRNRANPQTRAELPRTLPRLALAYGSLVKRLTLVRFGAQFGTQLALLSCNMSSTDDRKLRFEFRWYSRETDTGLEVFLHLLDSQDRIRLQGNHRLCRYNQDPWGFIAYSFEVAPQPSDYGNSYNLRLGIWKPKTGERLPVVYGKGLAVRPSECEVSLGAIELRW